MTEGTHEQADALLRRWDDQYGHCYLGSETRAYLATRPAPLGADEVLAKKAVAQTIPDSCNWYTIHGVREQAEKAALHAIKLAKEQQG